MLLLLKTNDLLRSIALRLKAEHNLDSFTEVCFFINSSNDNKNLGVDLSN